MRTSSAKAKGRRACQELQDLILRWFPDLTSKDVRVTPSGSTGEDIQLSEAASKAFPYAVEVKNQERLNLWAAIAQTQEHSKKTGLQPLLAFRRNRSEMFVVLRAEHFLELVGVVDSQKVEKQNSKRSLDAQGLVSKCRSYGFDDAE